jgi:RNA polymerase sigma-70 factor (ECF subfamily)
MAASNQFPTTTWTLVLSAGTDTDDLSTRALESLCQTYWYPLYAFVRRRGYSVEQAQDLTQEFFARVLEKRYIERADRTKGRFRSFLLSALKYFLFDETDRRNALKRNGGRPVLPFEVLKGEEYYQHEPSHQETPERIFERRWALALLDRVMARLRDEFIQEGRAEHFNRLKNYLLSQGTLVPYAQLAPELQMTEGALRTAIHRIRKRYRSILRQEIADTVAGESEVDAEIQYLAGILAAK